LAGTAHFPGLASAAIQNPYVDIANLGVRVFFVISGFLITGLLMGENRKSGTISLRRFYLRRTLRIFPAYYAFIGAVAALAAMSVVHITVSDVAHALTYTMNYFPGRSWSVGHLWSLAVEEQFYLLWPLTVLLLGLRRAGTAALAVIVVVPFLRVAESMLMPEWRDMIGITFDTTADALAIGCLLALKQEELDAKPWFRRVVDSRWIIPTLFAVGLLVSVRYRPALLVGMPVVQVTIALAVARCVRRPQGAFGRLLNHRLLVYIGTLSYSIYLWQQLFLDRYSSSAVTAFPLNLSLVLAAAMASYYIVERPFLRWRARIERRVLG
ncbi:MAG: acyltransferase, partial [Gemmatimonadota bacterium]|nr:acyltransferase [Gemmatimonadota bacterium]